MIFTISYLTHTRRLAIIDIRDIEIRKTGSALRLSFKGCPAYASMGVFLSAIGGRSRDPNVICRVWEPDRPTAAALPK